MSHNVGTVQTVSPPFAIVPDTATAPQREHLGGELLFDAGPFGVRNP